MTQKRYVRLVKFVEETGYTEKAARRKIEDGVPRSVRPRCQIGGRACEF